jgi:uncharacterized protein
MNREHGDQSVRRILELATPYYAGRDPAHDIGHIHRILSRLEAFSARVSPAPRPRLLAFLACFHGLAVGLRDDAPLRERATRLLKELDWMDDDIATAFEMVPRHTKDPKTPEEYVVHDANAVELLGAMGIAKAFTTGGARGQDYLTTIRIFEKNHLDRVVFRTPYG